MICCQCHWQIGEYNPRDWAVLTSSTWNFTTFTIFWFSAVGTVAKWLGASAFLTVSVGGLSMLMAVWNMSVIFRHRVTWLTFSGMGRYPLPVLWLLDRWYHHGDQWSCWICLPCMFLVVIALIQISFPVLTRFSFGVYGAYWPVFSRALSACVWNGVNNVTGGQCVVSYPIPVWEYSADNPVHHAPRHFP
jgi:NCS1 family nucleobase:cation symporter-1